MSRLLHGAASLIFIGSLSLAPCLGANAAAGGAAKKASAKKASAPGEDVNADGVMRFGPFGQVYIYTPKDAPQAVVLFISGDGGWNKGVVDMARALVVKEHVLVVGIDIRTYLKNAGATTKKCVYVAADFEGLSKYIQRTRKFGKYLQPFIFGYSSGATLAYVVHAEAPINTFAGALSLGFCPDLDLKKEICAKNSLAFTLGKPPVSTKQKKPSALTNYVFSPAESGELNWVVLHGNKDQVCSLGTVQSFVKKTPGAALVELDKVGHGFAVQKNWMRWYHEATAKVMAQSSGYLSDQEDSSVEGVPLVERLPEKVKADYFVVFFSGDGGWADLDDGVAAKLAEEGIPVVGWNSLQYFWSEKDEVTLGKDLTRVIHYYQHKLALSHVQLVGYSFGADVAPFFAANIDEKLRALVKSVVLLGPGKTAHFEFHLEDWIDEADEGFSVKDAVAHLDPLKVLCLYGKKEEDSLCRIPGMPNINAIELEGGHHFGGEYEDLAAIIQKHVSG